MTPDELIEAGEALFGQGWKSAVARLLDVDPRRIKHWLDETRPIPPGIRKELVAELRRRGKHAFSVADKLERS